MLRGDNVISFDGKAIEENIFGDISEGVSYEFKVKRPLNNETNDTQTVLLNIIPKVYNYKVSQKNIFTEKSNNKKIAYYIYDSFTTTSPLEISESFKYFKDNGVSELIIDLRYNGGGSVGTAQYFLSHIKSTRVGQLAFQLKYNDINSNNNRNGYFFNVDNALDFDRIIFLTSPSTASASELLINALQPYANVVLIGDTTYGKPVGMSYESNGDRFIYWLINFSVVNANGIGNYFDGINPNCYVNEKLNFQRDDIRDTLLNEALYYIKNSSCNNTGISVTSDDFVKLD